jgi:hypothetical protein
MRRRGECTLPRSIEFGAHSETGAYDRHYHHRSNG